MDVLQELYEKACLLDPSQQLAFLKELQKESPDLAEDIASLLAVDTGAQKLDHPLVAEHSMEGRSLGPYVIERELGRGGMGQVYLARQEQPVARKVAIKFIASWGGNEELHQRFAFEQMTLAKMNHSYIARLFESAKTSNGQPYFVMEYVDGEHITHYVRRKQLSLEARMLLFIKVCEGIAHAHLRGVLHRDIKPANILVVDEGGVAIPKIIDFGIARPLDNHQNLTNTGQARGTWSYMSPEQVQTGLIDHDFRTDVYSLGATLYELLVGMPPLIWRPDASPITIGQDICQKKPEKPSLFWRKMKEGVRLEQAANFGQSGPSLVKELERDLDWIVMQALEKEPERRYHSVTRLLEDIHRYHKGQPVEAGPPGMAYVWGKFVARHKVMVGTSSIALILIFVLMGWALSERAMAIRQQLTAQHEAEISARVITFLEETFQEADPYQADGRTATARSILDSAAIKIQTELNSDLEIRARLLSTIGGIYGNYGAYDRGQELLQEARTLQIQLGEEARYQLTQTLAKLGEINFKNYHFEEAKCLLETVLAQRRVAPGKNNKVLIKALIDLTNPLIKQAEFGAARSYIQEAVVLAEQNYEPVLLIQALHILANLESTMGHLKESAAQMDTALILADSLPHLNRSLLNDLLNKRAILYCDLGENVEATALYQQILQRDREVLGDKHPDIAATMGNIGQLLQSQGKNEEAREMYRKILKLLREILPEGHPLEGKMRQNLGNTLLHLHRESEAEEQLTKALEINQKAFGNDHLITAFSMHHLGLLYATTGNPKAKALLGGALAVRRKVFGDSHPHVAISLYGLAYRLWKDGEYNAAEDTFNEAFKAMSKAYGPRHSFTAKLLSHMGSFNAETNRLPLALEYYQRAADIHRENNGPLSQDLASSLYRQGKVLNNLSRWQQALGQLQEAEMICLQNQGEDYGRTSSIMAESARSLNALGFPGAEQMAVEAFALVRDKNDQDKEYVLHALVDIYTRNGRKELARHYDDLLCQLVQGH